jgi:Fe-S cluster assembly protein SufB
LPNGTFTYFRINQAGTGQFENLLWQMKEVTFHLEGCTAPSRDENQAVAELIALTMPRSKSLPFKLVSWKQRRKRWCFNFVTKRGICEKTQKFWTQVETGSAIT